MTKDEKIGMRIREKRKEKGLTLAGLAALLPSREDPSKPITPQAVFGWEKGEDTVPDDRHEEIAAALDCGVEELFGPVGRGVKNAEAARIKFALAVSDSGLSPNARTILHRLVLDDRLFRVEDGFLEYLGTLNTIANACRDLPVEDVESVWPEVMDSGFVEPVTDVPWHIRLIFP